MIVNCYYSQSWERENVQVGDNKVSYKGKIITHVWAWEPIACPPIDGVAIKLKIDGTKLDYSYYTEEDIDLFFRLPPPFNENGFPEHPRVNVDMKNWDMNSKPINECGQLGTNINLPYSDDVDDLSLLNITQLNKKLEGAIEKENYEECARIRDEIKKR